MKITRNILVVGCLLLGVYLFWSHSGRSAPEASVNLKLAEIQSIGERSDRGNVVGFQTYMMLDDYMSRKNFYRKIDGFLKEADENGFIHAKTVVLFPEYIGTWLLLAGEKQSLITKSTMEKAMVTMTLSNLFSFVKNLILSPEVDDRVIYSLMRMKSETMAEIYHDVFSSLAKKYQVTIIAGSIVLSEPKIIDNKIKISDGRLYNVSVVYKPDGTPFENVVRKVYPINTELPFTAKGVAEDISVFDLPIGKTGVLICADSWYPTSYDVLEKQNVEFIAVPSFLPPEFGFKTIWRGYNFGAKAEGDEDLNDIGNMTCRDAWLKYSLAGRIKTAGAKNGFNVFLRGDFLDMGSDGASIIVKDGNTVTGKLINGSSMINLWL
ncbi:MAG: carbon-nitrogen hydrolase [Desulfobacteraceae bacterium]|nr:carbon-nitrogen hydrolase [Desulfobacteraceae bacterium]MBC2757580.1 carbon-nitrogen hydrolase [Desulfobacteraceae bacterium]